MDSHVGRATAGRRLGAVHASNLIVDVGLAAFATKPSPKSSPNPFQILSNIRSTNSKSSPNPVRPLKSSQILSKSSPKSSPTSSPNPLQNPLQNHRQTDRSKQTAPNRQLQTNSSKQTVPNRQLQTDSSQTSPNRQLQTDTSKQTPPNRLLFLERHVGASKVSGELGSRKVVNS